MKVVPIAKVAVFGTVIASLCGCASIITSGDRKIQINSTPTAATVTVYDSKSNVVVSSPTPTKVKLKKGSGYFKGADYRLVLEKAGFQPREFEIKHGINGWYFGNFILGGFLGLVIIDPLTGGMWVLKPDKIDAELSPIQTSASGIDGGHSVVLSTVSPRH